LSLLARFAGYERRAAVTLQTATDDPAMLMSPMVTAVSVREEGPDPVEIMGKTVKARRLAINWDDQQRMLWVDKNGWPLRMERDDGLTAVLARQIKYQQITKPGVAEIVPTSAAGTYAGHKKDKK